MVAQWVFQEQTVFLVIVTQKTKKIGVPQKKNQFWSNNMTLVPRATEAKQFELGHSKFVHN